MVVIGRTFNGKYLVYFDWNHIKMTRRNSILVIKYKIILVTKEHLKILSRENSFRKPVYHNRTHLGEGSGERRQSCKCFDKELTSSPSCTKFQNRFAILF